MNTHLPKVVEARGYVVPKDSMAVPKVIPVDESKLKKIPVGKPKVVPTNTNVHPAGQGRVVVVDESKLRVITPGVDTFSVPKVVSAIDSPFISGVPEIMVAKNMDSKDQNPQNFSHFSKLQGLKSKSIRSILSDKSGNLWLGTRGGGVTKFDGSHFTHFTKNQGLTDNSVFSIFEDKSGNLWFGTWGNGITKYDGQRFTNYTEKEGLVNNAVVSIIEDKSGNLWFGTYGGGVSKFDGKRFTNYSKNEGLINNNVCCIIEDKAGNLWFGLDRGGICKFDGKRFTHFTENQGLSNNSVWTIVEDEAGNLWFGTDGGGVSKYEPPKKVGQMGKFIHYSTNEGLCSNAIRSILEDKTGNLWFGSDGGGACKFDGDRFIHFTENDGLINNLVYAITEDKSGNLWFSTDGGVSKYNGQRFTHYAVNEGINNRVSSICEDQSGALWMASWGGGIFMYNGQSFTQITEAEGLSNDQVMSILEDKFGNIWFGTWGGGVSKLEPANVAGKLGTFTYFTEKEGLGLNAIQSILEDKSGCLWFGTDGAGVTKFDGRSFTRFTQKEGLSGNYIYAMEEDKFGNIWFSAMGGGLTKYEPPKTEGKSGTFTHFTTKEGMPSNAVSAIYEDKSGNLWFGTDEGVVKYDGQQMTHFTENEGLCNNSVNSIIQDKSGNILFGTSLGISLLSPSKLDFLSKKIQNKSLLEDDVIFKNFSYDDGFLGIGCNRNSLRETKDGNIWIGTNDRVTVYYPTKFDAIDKSGPNMQLTGLSLFNESIAWEHLDRNKDSTIILGNGVKVSDYSFFRVSDWYSLPEQLSLAHDNNYLTFHFIGITMNQAHRVKYKYKLEGIDANWSALSERTEAPYGNLPHGNYTFKVKAMNSEGVWSAPFEYTFTIRPPWWKTWWAYTTYALLTIGSIVAYIRWRELAFRARQKELEVKVDEATVVIRHQKEEVEKQKDLAEEQKQLAEEQRHIVEEKNREILSSIKYAKRIQTAILPPPRVVKEFLKNSFILYLPKDIVAGDFYWMENIDSTIYFAACDCTGHGVPGAMVSVVCNNALNRSLNEFAEREPGKIFDRARDLVLENFSKSDDEVKDGMDASLCALNMQTMELFWAGANNPLWIYRAQNKYIEEIKADKQPIGKGYEPKPFTTHRIALYHGDIIYLFTDGYADQFGGEKNKKLTKAKFRDLLLSLAEFPMEEQRTKLLSFHDDYRGAQEQIDDVCVIGVRV